MTVVLDTATLLWWTADRPALSERAAGILSEATDIVVSTISFWEIGIKVRKGRLALPVSLREYTGRVLRTDRVRVVPVDTETWLRNVELAWDHRDPADRTIVATAQVAGADLVTSDRRILDFYPRAVW